MWSYERRLQYPVNIKEPNAETAKVIISQYGGPDGELGASMRYLSQRFTMPYNEVAGLLTDIGSEAAKWRFLCCIRYNLSPIDIDKVEMGGGKPMKNQYILLKGNAVSQDMGDFEELVKKAALLALLEKKYITQRQYEQCADVQKQERRYS